VAAGTAKLRAGVLRAGVLFAGVVVVCAGVLGACAPRMVDLHRIRRIEAAGRFVWEAPGRSPRVDRLPLVIQGERLQALVAAARCRRGAVLWKGGIPATLILEDGTRLEADGFSFYGRFLRIHGAQWCVIPWAVWRALWQASPGKGEAARLMELGAGSREPGAGSREHPGSARTGRRTG
jgi:hypothetical protein